MLAPGTRLGPYEIVAPIGAGGMGEVYRARDTRLDRSVAVKVLPADFATNPQLRLRFEREAKVISSLNHPNICTLYDVGDDYLVMELIEGESLAQRAARGPLPLADVLRYGVQIAEALNRAHRAGIVHRDLKPGNVMITKSGAKLLDFGLAKEAPVQIDFNAETAQQRPITEQGTLLGTFQYMAPEQLENSHVDYRADIFALGCVLYEMATGRRAFEGKTRTSLIAAIVASMPRPVHEIAPTTPASLESVIAGCLEKDPEQRWQSAHDVALNLRAITTSVDASRVAPRPKRRALVAAAVLLAAAIGAGVTWMVMSRSKPMMAAGLLPPPLATLREYVLSPDGNFVAMIAMKGDKSSLVIRRMSDGALVPIDGSDGAHAPFWSPDSGTVAFFARGKLYRAELAGGSPLPICDVGGDGRGGSWNRAGQIVFAKIEDALYLVPAAGGTPSLLIKPDKQSGPNGNMWPSFLPGDRHFIYLADAEADIDHRLMIGSVDPKERPRLVASGIISNAQYVEPGYLLYVRVRTLVAQRFDWKTGKLSGDAIPIAEQLAGADIHLNFFSASEDGKLVYTTFDPSSRLHLLDGNGKELATYGEAADWVAVETSPDGKFAILERVDAMRRHSVLWLLDLARGTMRPFANDADWQWSPVWSADSRRVLFKQFATPEPVIVEKGIDGSGRHVFPIADEAMVFPTSRNGDWLAGETGKSASVADVVAMSLTTHRKIDIAATKHWESDAHFSPDGRAIAYTTGDVMVIPFPPTGSVTQVSSDGGWAPRWSADGKTLYYMTPSAIMRSSIDGQLEAGVPQKVIDVRLKDYKNRTTYALLPDGRFLVDTQDSYEAPTHLVLNWTSMLRRR